LGRTNWLNSKFFPRRIIPISDLISGFPPYGSADKL
jgi:hypothetical protein